MVFLRAVSAICYPRASSTQCQPGDGLILGQSSNTGPALSQRCSAIACRLSSLSSAVIGLIFPRFQLAGLIPSFVQEAILYRCPENNPTFNELIASTRVGGRRYGRGLATHPSTLEVNCDIHAAKSLNPYLYTLTRGLKLIFCPKFSSVITDVCICFTVMTIVSILRHNLIYFSFIT